VTDSMVAEVDDKLVGVFRVAVRVAAVDGILWSRHLGLRTESANTVKEESERSFKLTCVVNSTVVEEFEGVHTALFYDERS
jgi:hypothetical protein